MDMFSIISNSTNEEIFIDTFSGVGVGCTELNGCSKHGQCDFCTQKCTCDAGYGSPSDIIMKGRDIDGTCAPRVCPPGKAFAEVPINNTAHVTLAECSNVGICDRSSGECQCTAPYEGPACERLRCPNSCSGHGRCLSMKEIAHAYDTTMPKHKFDYDSASVSAMTNPLSTAWDSDMIFGCVCDSSWKVGYGPRQIQLSEYFGPDCSLKRCPRGDDPFTPHDEENCHLISQKGALGGYMGEAGNICHIDCSNRGVCDYSTGMCKCFEGSWGSNCGLIANQGTRQ